MKNNTLRMAALALSLTAIMPTQTVELAGLYVLGGMAAGAGITKLGEHFFSKKYTIDAEQNLQQSITDARAKLAILTQHYAFLLQPSFSAQQFIGNHTGTTAQAYELDNHVKSLQTLYSEIDSLRKKILAAPVLPQETTAQKQLQEERILTLKALDEVYYRHGAFVTALQQFIELRSTPLQQLQLLTSEAQRLTQPLIGLEGPTFINYLMGTGSHPFPLQAHLATLEQCLNRLQATMDALNAQPYKDIHVQRTLVIADAQAKELQSNIAKIKHLPAFQQECVAQIAYERAKMERQAALEKERMQQQRELERAQQITYEVRASLEREKQRAASKEAERLQAEAARVQAFAAKKAADDRANHTTCYLEQRGLQTQLNRQKQETANLEHQAREAARKLTNQLGETQQLANGLKNQLTAAQTKMKQLEEALNRRDTSLIAHEKNTDNLRHMIIALQMMVEKLEKEAQPFEEIEGAPCHAMYQQITNMHDKLKAMLVAIQPS